jgi:hypothetical protein
MTDTIDLALDAACHLLTEDHHLVEALSASRRGRFWFRPDYDMEIVEVSKHLDALELEAHKAANLCANSGLPTLADCCRKIAHRIAVARRNGVDDCTAMPDLSKLTTAGMDALEHATDLRESRY